MCIEVPHNGATTEQLKNNDCSDKHPSSTPNTAKAYKSDVTFDLESHRALSHPPTYTISFRNQDLNAVCDVTCRDNSALMFVDPLTGLIVIVDGNSTGERNNSAASAAFCLTFVNGLLLISRHNGNFLSYSPSKIDNSPLETQQSAKRPFVFSSAIIDATIVGPVYPEACTHPNLKRIFTHCPQLSCFRRVCGPCRSAEFRRSAVLLGQRRLWPVPCDSFHQFQRRVWHRQRGCGSSGRGIGDLLSSESKAPAFDDDGAVTRSRWRLRVSFQR